MLTRPFKRKLAENAHGAGFVGYAANAFVCQAVLAGLKSVPAFTPTLISFVASAIKKLVAFCSLEVRAIVVPFIMIHCVADQLLEAEKFPLASASLVVALIFADEAFPVIVKIRYDASDAL